MTAEPTDPYLAHAEEIAQQIARRARGNAYIVAIKGPRRYDVETGDEPPKGRHVVRWYKSGSARPGEPDTSPRACRKAYDIYEKDNPAAPIGTVKGQTRGEAYGLARRDHPGLDLVLGVAGPGSRDEVVRVLEREEKKARQEEEKGARRRARQAKEAERDRLKEQRERSIAFQAERRARQERIEAEEARRQALGLPYSGHDPASPIVQPDGPITDVAGYISESRAATSAAIKKALADLETDAVDSEEEEQADTGPDLEFRGVGFAPHQAEKPKKNRKRSAPEARA